VCSGCQVVEELLARGVSLSACDGKGRTPLHTAIHHSRVRVAIRLMVEATSDGTMEGSILNARDGEGRTPLLLACNRELPQVAMALLDLHVSLDLEQVGGWVVRAWVWCAGVLVPHCNPACMVDFSTLEPHLCALYSPSLVLPTAGPQQGSSNASSNPSLGRSRAWDGLRSHQTTR